MSRPLAIRFLFLFTFGQTTWWGESTTWPTLWEIFRKNWLTRTPKSGTSKAWLKTARHVRSPRLIRTLANTPIRAFKVVEFCFLFELALINILGVECHDTSSGMVCGKCPRGYVGDGRSCRRVEMCQDKPCFPWAFENLLQPFHQLRKIFRGVECRDTEFGVACGSCPPGHEGNGKVCNAKRDTCNERPCGDGQQCVAVDFAPFFECRKCPAGFTSDDASNCVDIDECYTLRPCDPKVRCTNLSPGFSCEPCPPGFKGHYAEGIFMASVSDRTFQRQRCEDINECRDRTTSCGPNTKCVNTEGSYECPCLSGFTRSNTSTGCVPIPGICADGITVCDKNAICRYLGGNRYGCKCKVGFAGDGFHCGGDRDLDGWPDQDMECIHPSCRQDNCPSIPVSMKQMKQNKKFNSCWQLQI